ncbi:MAG: class I SAM-dependent methyltransferase [Brevinematia bacterium]
MGCKLCGSSDLSFALRPKRYEFDVFICNSCGVLFRYPFPTKDEIKSYYTEGYYSGQNGYSYLDERKIKGSHLVWDRRIDKLISIYTRENLRSPINILDVGCSFGGFLERARMKGLQPYGIEISEYSANYARSRGIEVFVGDVGEVELGSERFDIITMIEVVEHLEDPLSVMKKIYNSNTKGGVLLIQTANINGLQSKLWGRRYHYYLPGHLHYFSNTTLKNLLRGLGYRKILEFYPVEFDLFPKLAKTFLNTRGVYRYVKVLKTLFYHLLGKFRIGDFTLTSSMVIVGVK